MSFYQRIQAFSDFSQIHDEKNFVPVPDDWMVVVADVKGSTLAIQEGRFKVVNMLGAAAITISANAMGELNTISVFGGDGATLLMPQKVYLELRQQYVGLIKLCKEKFNLEMRVGAVAVEVLNKMGCPVLVGKYQISKQTVLAQFLGSGVAKAEKLIKAGLAEADILKVTDPSLNPNLQGLSCRMDKFPSKNGKILSLIVKPRTDGDTIWIRQVLLRQIKEILNGSFQAANPISESELRWKLVPETLGAEIKFQSSSFVGAVKTALKALMANLMLKFNISAGGFLPSKYKQEVPLQSDFKKFDDNLRMVIDCQQEQVQKIIELLKDAHSSGHIFYGIHESDYAVATCLTFSASQGEHVHFVDGDGCGYTTASIQLKKQIAAQD